MKNDDIKHGKIFSIRATNVFHVSVLALHIKGEAYCKYPPLRTSHY